MSAALDSAERAKTLVQRLLAFARRQPLQPGPVEVSDVVTSMQDLVASTIGPRIALNVDVHTGLPAALADRNQLEMAILNLCVNARDAMPDGGNLWIRLQEEAADAANTAGLDHGRYIKLSVTDTGSGMSEETAERAIEPFFSTKGIGHGTGLGLSMVHGLARQLGGGLAIRSRLGEGTTIELFLPLAGDQTLQMSCPPAAMTIDGHQGIVLLVDDELSVRESTAEMLRDLGFEVEEAQDAAQALQRLEARRPDVMVTDHLMPGTTGARLARLVHEIDPSIPTLIISGYAEVEDIPSDLARLAKPFRLHELAAGLAVIMDQAKRP